MKKIDVTIGILLIILSLSFLIYYAPEPTCTTQSSEGVFIQFIPLLGILGGIILIPYGLSELDII